MVSSNNSINNTVGASITGVTNTLTVTNPSNTASSAARATITVGGGSASDPTLNFNVTGVTDWEMGIDNNDSDKWKLSQGTSLGTNDVISAYVAGQINFPLQPCFRAYLPTVSNVTGDGTIYTLGDTDVADPFTEVFDIGNNFTPGASGGAFFTAPVDGIYYFNVRCRITGLSASNTDGQIGCSDPIFRGSFGAMSNLHGVLAVGGWTMLQLSALDTIQCNILVSGGTKTVSIDNISNITTLFLGRLIQ